MIAMQPPRQPAINNKALAWTIGIHALLFLLFIVFKYTIPQPEPVTAADGGLEVNLGTSENGSGSDQPMNTKKPSEYQAAVVYKTAASVKSTVPENIVRSAEADAPEVVTPKKKKGNAEATEKGRIHQNPRYVYSGEHGPGGNSAAQNSQGSSEGNTTGPGDRGVPGGTPGAANYTGTPGNGTGGINHTLTGRDITPKAFEAEFNEGGVVVIRVTVDRSGSIVDKRVVSSSSPHLTRLALEKLASAKFSRSEGNEPQQFGNVTIRFKNRQ
jgi:outer membrane biosynthesis protein TonB